MINLNGHGLVSAQQITARLELGKREAFPKFFQYSRADKGLVTLGYMTRKSSRYYGLSHYDEKFGRTWTKQVLMQNGRKNVDFFSVLGQDIMVFVSEYFPKERAIKTYYYLYDLAGNQIKEEQVISVVPNEKQHRVNLKYVQSINRKVLLCYKNLDNSEESERMIFTLFEEGGDKGLNGEITLPYPDEKFQIKAVQVSNEGNVFILGKYFRVNRASSPDDFEFVLVKYDTQSGDLKEFPLNLGEHFITDLTLKLDPDENMYVAGFYSLRSSHEIVGTIFQKVNQDGDVEVSGEQKFDQNTLSRFLSERQIDRGAELRYFYLDDIVLRSDGGVLLLAEKYYTSFNSYVDIYGYWVDQKIHHYDEVLVSSVNGNGNLEWSAVVTKRQSSQDSENLGYVDVISGESIYILYEYQPRKAGRTVYFNEISMEGGLSAQTPLLGTEEDRISFYPHFSEQISNHAALLVYYHDRDKVYSVVKMEFD